MKKALTRLGTLIAAAGLAISPVAAQAQETNPGTPDHQHFSVSGFKSYEQLVSKLKQIEQNSQGRVSVEAAGHSNRGRAIHTATVGHGDKVIMITSQIHGNEPTGTEALVNLLQYLGSSRSPRAEQLRNELTLVAIPQMNPDAAVLNRRANDMPWEDVTASFPSLANVEPAWNYYTRTIQGHDYSKRPGFDVNRDFHPDLDYQPQPEDFPGRSSQPGWYITPEAQTIRDVYRSLTQTHGKVDVYIDLHHQGPYYKVEGSDDLVTLSLSGQFVPDPNSPEGAKYSEYADRYNYDFSRQLNVAAYNALQEMGHSPFDNITLYPQGLDLPGTALGSFALNGSGTVLFEVRGQTQSMGQKKRGQLVKAVETGLNGILDSVAAGTVHEIDPEDYEKIPSTDR
ncbi:zinc carboxypeptidase [Melghirimyces profundicolus]|uniref:Zinc carboxypeptidase n=1 Tax=Melghirimyces profundicolus TaxID=1242148 RepID=A0A2T6BXJ2_9BACL|nr:M14 family zinc carboxypeptidase [Melghirimyces profundicolus]PTX60799.1 zinc carboxypeptidase [Melghirimyces profundicolus]